MTAFQAIDADGHVLDNRELIIARLPKAMREREWAFVPRNTWDSTLGGKLGQHEVNAPEWLAAMDEGPMEQAVLFPTRLLNIGCVQERELAVALCQAYNSYLFDEYLKFSPRFKGVAVLPMQDIEAAVVELRRAVTELGMVTAMLPTSGTPGRPLFGHPMYNPLFEEAQRLGVPLALHANVTNPHGPEIDPFERMIESHTVVHPFGQMRQLTSMIWGGVFERFPALTFASLEAGATWVPFFMDRIDEEGEKRASVEAPNVPEDPSRYFKEGRIYVHFEAGEGLIPETLQYAGEDWFVYASDFPHWDHEYPRSLQKMRDHPGLSEETKVKILRENAKRLFKL
jgi:predicted TIM-barrel fold metal-dependent hydrolase